MGGLGPMELVIVLVIVLVVFGAGKLPSVGGALGQALKNFKKSSSGEESAPDKTEKKDDKKEGS
ncbi:MAG: twin-arginine translocase TatA/TatE family subunit [Deltaproteobacteria bacterium]|nr:twin-arginine translocase TatA/TatE family subunit [Deltaproteobacteria bacterium]